jgi:hypothetical protein
MSGAGSRTGQRGGPGALGAPPRPASTVMGTLARIMLVVLGAGVGVVLAVIIGFMTGIIPFVC